MVLAWNKVIFYHNVAAEDTFGNTGAQRSGTGIHMGGQNCFDRYLLMSSTLVI